MSFLTQLETDSEKIFLLQTHQVAGSHSCDRSWTGSFAVNAHVSKVVAPTQGFGTFSFSPIADADRSVDDDVEVGGRISLFEDDLSCIGLKVLKSVHDFFVGVSSSFVEKLMIKKDSFNKVPILFSQVILCLI